MALKSTLGRSLPMPNLTPTETRILHETDGRSIPEIAAALGMTPRAVKFHSDNLRKAYGVKNRRDLIPFGKEK